MSIVKGTLKGYDALMNLVLDDVQETVRGKLRPSGNRTAEKVLNRRIVLNRPADEDGNESTRPLGLVVARGTLLVVITPVDGSEPIANPFAQPDEAS